MSGWKEDYNPNKERNHSISINLPHSKWVLLRGEAARRRTAMSKLVCEWIEPHLASLEETKS